MKLSAKKLSAAELFRKSNAIFSGNSLTHNPKLASGRDQLETYEWILQY